mmetsp:Transcript_5206/g.8565  ORF Transcript_5206/g.8565 Transcript_5206/m.8565 type:complete len:275 (+) Transcript_5206:239-1063(+)|eukprot:CAMPEP_0119013772 /NCGR_PEP_ID=MMETSP1176-20130426/8930_1 /TAXON_ID=265551 /ORGANISM="Synedropsis recta cf, Strain CCMP1620" /LENGTH=274 /DNA_ID=CAMNT_0006966889 /DNA_START=176 /DNA_END=1000 /DNA_ORIENTATION=+
MKMAKLCTVILLGVTTTGAFQQPMGTGSTTTSRTNALHVSLSTPAFPTEPLLFPAGLVMEPPTSFLFQEAEQPQQVLPQTQPFQVYCDLDGVLVDFAAGIRELFPENPPQSSAEIQDLNRGLLWNRVSGADSFFERLPWMPGGQQLWESIQHLQPDILTGVPPHHSSRREKLKWCRRELGIQVAHVDMAGQLSSHVRLEGEKQEGLCNVITCWSHNKHHESGPNAVLIDDRDSLREAWEAKGGIFVHHTGDVDHTLQQLRHYGILEAPTKGMWP